jgi:hypothetical protein
MRTFRFSIAIALVGLAAVLLQDHTAVAGEDAATVKGSVTLKDGQPLSGGGRIFIHLKDGQFVGAKIQADGTFKVDRVPVGKHKVTVEAEGVPKYYGYEEKSGLLVEVKKGNNEYKIAVQ